MRTFSALLTAALVLAGAMAVQPLVAHAGGLKSWDKTKSGAARWKSLTNFGNAAVLDTQTGLVWETTPTNQELEYFLAVRFCANRLVGGQRGFRLPTVGELATLIDPSQSPPLPPGSPFSFPTATGIWTSTPMFLDINEEPDGVPGYEVFAITFGNDFTIQGPSNGFIPWCVRGPGGN